MRASELTTSMSVGSVVDYVRELFLGMLKLGERMPAVLLKGESGIGKSEIVAGLGEFAAHSIGREPVSVTFHGVDVRYGFATVFWPDSKSNKIVRLDTGVIPDDVSLIFIDEVQSMNLEGRAEIRSLLHSGERRIGNIRIPDDCLVMLASNLKGEGGLKFTAGEMDEARMHRIELQRDHRAWLQWAKTRVRPDIQAFVEWNSPPKNEKGIETEEGVLGVIPGSGRTLYQTSKMLDASDSKWWEHVLHGQGWGDLTREFLSLRNAWEAAVPPERIWADPMGAMVPTQEKAVAQFAVVGRLIEAMGHNRDKLEESWTYLLRLHKEMTTMAVNHAMTRWGDEIVNCQSMSTWVAQNRHLLSL